MKTFYFPLPFLIFGVMSSPSYSEDLIRYDDFPDPVPGISTYATQGNSWDHDNITYFFLNGTADISGTAERQSVRDAFALWANQTPLTFTEVSSAAGADILVSWQVGDHGDGSSFDAQGGVLAHAFYPPPNGSFAGDIHFDDTEVWTTETRSDNRQPIDLVTVAAHEIGHALGLAHSGDATALMAPYYNGSHRFLSTDDIAGIQLIYPDNNIIQPGFNAEYYLDTNSDLKAAFGSDYQAALSHWKNNGIYEGRRASVAFDVQFYLDVNPDLSAAFGTNYQAALSHWVNNGRSEGRRASREFDVRYYLNQNADLKAAFGTNYQLAVDHWANNGLYEGRKGSSEFDVKYYLAQYADLGSAFGTDYFAAVTHWTANGLPSEGRRGSVNFDVMFYLNTYADLSAAFGNNYTAAMNHWISNGISEGRTGAP